jgi:glycosyltransferase involved in cell wall biosynthesis
MMRRFLAPPPDAPVALGGVPSFSVVIPAYQAAGTIADAVESALAQTLDAHEVIVCDDGSTDDIASAVAPFGDRIVFLRRRHRGPGAARNAALRVASGDFVVMLDADDFYEPERLSALGELATARRDLDILATDLYYEKEGRPQGRFYEFTDFVIDDQRRGIMEACFFACPAMRRARVLEVGGFDESLGIAEDWDLFIRLILSGSRAGLVNEPLMRYRKHPASTTADRARSLAARVAILEKVRSDAGLTPAEHRFLEACIARATSRAVLSHANELVRVNSAYFRRSLLGFIGTRGITPSTRLALSAAAVTPFAPTRLLRWQERRIARSPLRRSRLRSD